MKLHNSLAHKNFALFFRHYFCRIFVSSLCLRWFFQNQMFADIRRFAELDTITGQPSEQPGHLTDGLNWVDVGTPNTYGYDFSATWHSPSDVANA